MSGMKIKKCPFQEMACYASDTLIPDEEGMMEVYVVGLLKIGVEDHWVLLPFDDDQKMILAPMGSIFLQPMNEQKVHPDFQEERNPVYDNVVFLSDLKH